MKTTPRAIILLPDLPEEGQKTIADLPRLLNFAESAFSRLPQSGLRFPETDAIPSESEIDGPAKVCDGLQPVHEDPDACVSPLVAMLVRDEPSIERMNQMLPGVDLLFGKIESGTLQEKSPTPWCHLASAWAELLEGLSPALVILPHTIDGLQLAAGLAVRLQAACIPGVLDVEAHESGCCFHRLEEGGRVVSRIAAHTPGVIVTVDDAYRPRQVAVRSKCRRAVRVKAIRSETDTRCRVIGRRKPAADTRDLDTARVVVAVGRGMGEAEDLPRIQEFAATFPGSALAGSRCACDLGWIPPERQIGVTGKSVSPELYVACGISGAPQHIAGMHRSKTVVSINSDPHAAIFRHSDVGIVADMFSFVAAWIDLLQQCQQKGT
ncbi:electron transfer flavoprotein subunit alpha/FixB family protein [Desulfatirhabdium butyrativorans]|uniref:electron transfer flavoprotein subunit alpha/FixB family protein n=1 Tax=Desulfatirhabdium butyrativorans TaxID=340467 RepID=UPI0003F71BAB|nr:electron transfer flavoprotein subunit alpha/FixB family protein [Desulfatirhabdium butyrativorans]